MAALYENAQYSTVSNPAPVVQRTRVKMFSLAQRIHSSCARVKDYFEVLGEHGVHCEHVPLEEEGWLTPGGALRKSGWCMEMSFDDEAGGVLALKALQSYATRLDEKYGKTAFRYFSKADMRVLGGD
jgi:hypothetical protein